MKWAEIRAKADALKPHLHDRFSRDLLDGALLVAQQKGNPVRGNLFAAALRELITHTLHELAPDQTVSACGWYKIVPNTSGPTRDQGATYIVQGGLLDAFVKTTLKLDLDKDRRKISKLMERLNKLTHMRPLTAVSDARPVKTLVDETISTFLGLFELAGTCRASVEHQLIDIIDQELMNHMLADTIDALDELSTHTRIDEIYVDSVSVRTINNEEITYDVAGMVYVELQYGSDSDVRNDLGMTQDDSYPFTATVLATVKDPQVCLPNPLVMFDTSDFYN